MKDEIAAAVVFLTRIVKRNTNLTTEQMNSFSEKLALTLVERFRNHWYEDMPSKGQAYRCIRVSRNEPRDSVIDKTARDCGIKYSNLNLPAELTLWVDPREVSCRFGERGTVCPVAKFSQSRDDNRPLSPTTENFNLSSSVRHSDIDNTNANTRMPSPPPSPVPQNDNMRMSVAKLHLVNHSPYVFNRNVSNQPRLISRPQSRVWQPKPEQYRWVSKSIAARA